VTIRLFGALLSQDLKRTFSYRVNFWAQFAAQSAGEVAVAYFFWQAIFSQTTGGTADAVIGGFRFLEMVQYYVLVSLFGRLIRGREGFLISAEIYEGGLTKYLVFPLNYHAVKFTEHISFIILSLFQFALGYVCFALFFLDSFSMTAGLTWHGVLMGIFAAVTGSLFYFLLTFAIEALALFADNVWSLSVMFRLITNFLGGLYLPLSLFPGWAQEGLRWSPFPNLGFATVQLFLGRWSVSEFFFSQAVLLFWSVIAACVLYLIWRRGLKTYTGVGQ
jgi:ABC-2 type transport system permease protein